MYDGREQRSSRETRKRTLQQSKREIKTFHVLIFVWTLHMPPLQRGPASLPPSSPRQGSSPSCSRSSPPLPSSSLSSSRCWIRSTSIQKPSMDKLSAEDSREWEHSAARARGGSFCGSGFTGTDAWPELQHAGKGGKSQAKLCSRWGVSRGFVVLQKSAWGFWELGEHPERTSRG